VRERAAETAVQDQDLLAGPAVLQLVQQPRRRDTGAAQPGLERVRGGEVQAVAPVQHPVARQVHHHHVADAAAGQEHVDRPPGLPLPGIDHLSDSEGADARVTQDPGQVPGVARRSAQLAQFRVLVPGGGDDQGRAWPWQRVRGQPGAGRARHR
jgi:hypothetical protein